MLDYQALITMTAADQRLKFFRLMRGLRANPETHGRAKQNGVALILVSASIGASAIQCLHHSAAAAHDRAWQRRSYVTFMYRSIKFSLSCPRPGK
jgi:hypothetical protein